MSKSAPALTIGLEEECFLVNRTTGQLCTSWPRGLKQACQRAYPEQIVAEFLSSQVELITKPCDSIQSLHRQLSELRQSIIEIAAAHDLAPLAASSHPNACWREQIPNSEDRYERLNTVLQMTARRLLVGGMHIHVGILDQEERLRVLNEITWYLPLLLALSSSSPFWAGMDSGLHSFRLSVLSGLPRSGLPEVFESYQQYQDYLSHLLDSGAIEAERELWWDIRLSGRFPTVEARVTDTCTSVMDAMGIAALYLCLIHRIMRGEYDKRENTQLYRALIQENRWRAQRYSLKEGSLLHHKENRLFSYQQIIDELLEKLQVDAKELDCLDYLQHVRTIFQRGTSADQQKLIYEAALKKGAAKQEALFDVTQFLIKETKASACFDKKKQESESLELC